MSITPSVNAINYLVTYLEYANISGLKGLSKLYFAFIYSRLNFACVIWNPHYNIHKLRLEIVQNRFVRFLNFKVNGVYKDAHDDRKEKEPVISASIGTSSVSNLLSKTTTLYASAKENIKRYSVLSTVSNPEGVERNSRLSFHSDNTLLDQLMRQLSLQNEIMFQVSKALNYCKTTKKFESSVEFLEAEKILLVASCAKEALTKEIQNVEDDSYEENVDSKSCGEVQISNLIFHPRENYKTDAHRDFTEYFLIVLTCGSIVLASDVVTAEENGTVSVKKSFNFSNLAADFEICVCVYAMRVGNKMQQNQELKSNCPSPKKILFYLKKGSRKYKVLNDVVYIKPSSFILWGKCEIRSPNLSKAKQQQSNNVLTLKMHHTPVTSSLSGTFSVKINTAVTLTNITSGFLTIGMDNEHGCTLWNRRWCVLEGYTLKYWNYPSEEGCNPLGSINLSKCLEQRISFADRAICARSRTLLLPVKYKQGEKKYLLSADSSSEVDKWQMDINFVIRSLKVWNCFNI